MASQQQLYAVAQANLRLTPSCLCLDIRHEPVKGWDVALDCYLSGHTSRHKVAEEFRHQHSNPHVCMHPSQHHACYDGHWLEMAT
jgi:hypothetical protein